MAQSFHISLYPQQDAPGARWHWAIERKSVLPGVTTRNTLPEAKKWFYAKIHEGVESGYTVHATFRDQTGGGHEGTYLPDGTLTGHRQIESTTGDLGPRCSILPRGSDQKGHGAGGVSASRRRKTLAARTGWDDLYDKVVAGQVKLLADGTFTTKATTKPGIIADAGDFQYLVAKILLGYKAAGSFPGSYAAPGALLASGVTQRTEAQVMARIAKAANKPPTPAANKPTGKTPAVSKPTGKTPAKPTGKTPAASQPTSGRKPNPGLAAYQAWAKAYRAAHPKASKDQMAAAWKKHNAAPSKTPSKTPQRTKTPQRVKTPPQIPVVVAQPERIPTPRVPTPRQPTPRVPTPVAAPPRTQPQEPQIMAPRIPTPRQPTPMAAPARTPAVLPGPQVQSDAAAELKAFLQQQLGSIF